MSMTCISDDEILYKNKFPRVRHEQNEKKKMYVTDQKVYGREIMVVKTCYTTYTRLPVIVVALSMDLLTL